MITKNLYPPRAETPPVTQTNPLYLLVHRYKEGMLRARQGDPKTEQVVQSVAEGMLTITDTRGQDAVEDWEVDELLEWTNGLNFDQYVKALFLPQFLVCPAVMVIFPKLLPTHLISVNVSRKSMTQINLTMQDRVKLCCM